jgi:hypothetical protein
MSVENDFLIFANIATNIESQTDYDVDPAVSNGFQSGTASSALFNKVLRQGTTGMALLAAFIQQQLPNQTVLDEGQTGLATLLASLTQALGTIAVGKSFTVIQNSVTSTTDATLAAAQMVGAPIASILRSGPTAAFTDTTDNASNLLAQFGSAAIGVGWELTISNQTSYNMTLAGGVGVTVPVSNVIEAQSSVRFGAQITDVSTPAVTFVRLMSGSL